MADNVAGHDRTLLRVAVILLPLAFVLLGCRNYTDNTLQPASPTAHYPQGVANPLPTGTVRGRVVWTGERPVVPPINGLIDTEGGAKWGDAPNPFAPRITDNGMADVMVWLTPVNSTQVKPWPYSPLVIEHAGGGLRAEQATTSKRVGFTRVDDEVELVPRSGWLPFVALTGGLGHTPENRFHLLRARGAAYFTLTFPELDKSRKRKLDTPGVVEFTSATGDFWNAVDVMVCEHPYYTATDSTGRFELANVPPGEYELTARVRNWIITGRERDPETGKIVRLGFADPVRLTKRVQVPADETVHFEVNADHFKPQAPLEK